LLVVVERNKIGVAVRRRGTNHLGSSKNPCGLKLKYFLTISTFSIDEVPVGYFKTIFSEHFHLHWALKALFSKFFTI
jgi:hypothetical protein